MPNGSLQRAQMQNQMNPCDVTGCLCRRHSLSRFCGKHAGRYYLYGHPLGVPVMRRYYLKELGQVSELLDRNRDHKGVKVACGEIQGFLTLCGSRDEMPADIAKLKWTSKVKPLDILKEAAAITLFRERYPHYFRDDRNYQVIMGLKCIELAPREDRVTRGGKPYKKQPSTTARKMLGETLWQTCGPLLMNIAKTAMTQKTREQAIREAQSQPLV